MAHRFIQNNLIIPLDLCDNLSHNDSVDDDSIEIVNHELLFNAARKHPPSKTALFAWEKVILDTLITSFQAVKMVLPSTDYVGHRYTVFNICGNKYRLITEIDYELSIIDLKAFWTHAEYSKRNNQQALMKGLL
jgi:mRNA interferase HigB